MSYESPRYQVERKIGRVEIRRYEPYLAASTDVEGSLERAGNRGFRVLARYIFGGNVGRDDAGSTKISMTTPVTQQRVGDRYRIRFMMPSAYTAETLPIPEDAQVTIDPVDGRRMAAIRYSGSWSRAGYRRNLEELRTTLTDADIEPTGEPIWARYDPPWKPWFLRRNEVLIGLAGDG